jgi:hypothetical protein
MTPGEGLDAVFGGNTVPGVEVAVAGVTLPKL